MPIPTKDDGRQYALVAQADILQSDFATGVGQAVIELPQNAIVTGGQLIVDTAFDSATSDTGEIGDVTTAARYVGAVDLTAVARTALIPTGFKTTATETNIYFENTEVGAAGTAGVARLIVEYIIDARRNENQGEV